MCLVSPKSADIGQDPAQKLKLNDSLCLFQSQHFAFALFGFTDINHLVTFKKTTWFLRKMPSLDATKTDLSNTSIRWCDKC